MAITDMAIPGRSSDPNVQLHGRGQVGHSQGQVGQTQVNPGRAWQGVEQPWQGVEQLSHNFITSKLESLVNWSRARSCWPATFGLACCAIEMMATGAAHYDLARYGMEVFRASPRQADLMIVAGRVSQKMAPVLRQIYDQMMEPKWVIAMGVCSSSGGMFNNYAIVQGVDQIVPVDVYAPGCPPGPETLLHAIFTLHNHILNDELITRKSGRKSGAAITVPQRDGQTAVSMVKLKRSRTSSA